MSATGPAPDESRPRAPSEPPVPASVSVDTRRYRWAVGVLAAVLVIGFLIYGLSTRNPAGTEGVPAGGRLHLFAAPLAASTLKGDANLNPPCTPARHDPRALNVCLLVKRAPLVLAFFVTNSSQCEREVSAMQAVSRRPALRGVQFAAVAVNGTHAGTAKAVRAHGWTIPVAYDADGAVGGAYGVTACPLLELASRGGTVAARLIGEHWLNRDALADQVRRLLAGPASGGIRVNVASGVVDAELSAEFPGLRLRWTALDARVRGSSRETRGRLRALSDRYLGAGVVAMRTKPIPHAYRTFFRQVGVDPDAARIPSEEAAVRRLLQGGFQSRDAIRDALLIALIETGVPVWALDAGAVDVDSLGIRVATAGDRLPDGATVAGGQLVVADREYVHATLFSEPAPEHAPGPHTRRVVLFAVAVDGVPAIHVEEALWMSADAIEAG